MSIVEYRNKYTGQIIFLAAADPDLDASPRWDVVNAGGGSGDISAHEADTTDVHGIADTALLETISGATSLAAAAVALHEADTTGVHGITDTSVLETTTGSAAKVSTHAAASDPHGDRANTTTAIATHAAASDPHGDRAAATTAISTHAAASDPHGDRANTTTQISTHAAASDPHGDRANTTTAIATHAAAADPHGDRANTTTAIATHAAAADPHGDRAWATALMQMSSARAATMPRYAIQNNITAASGTVYFGYFTAPYTLAYTTLTICSGSSSAASGITTAKLGLYSVDGSGNLTLIAAGANDTTMLASASTLYTAAITAGSLTAGNRYAVGVIQIASTMGSIRGAAIIGVLTTLTPVLSKLFASQSDLPSSVAVGSLASTGSIIFASVS